MTSALTVRPSAAIVGAPTTASAGPTIVGRSEVSGNRVGDVHETTYRPSPTSCTLQAPSSAVATPAFALAGAGAETAPVVVAAAVAVTTSAATAIQPVVRRSPMRESCPANP